MTLETAVKIIFILLYSVAQIIISLVFYFLGREIVEQLWVPKNQIIGTLLSTWVIQALIMAQAFGFIPKGPIRKYAFYYSGE